MTIAWHRRGDANGCTRDYLDLRFSAPDASVTEWDETRHVRETAELFWITSVRAGARPHVTSLVAVWLDEKLHFCTGADEHKAVNIRDNADVAMTTGRNIWDRGLDVVVEGDARRVSDDEERQRLSDAWSTKWDGRWHYEARVGYFTVEGSEPIIVFSVAPARILAFAKGDFAVTPYRF